MVLPWHQPTVGSQKWSETPVQDKKPRMLQILQHAGKDLKPGEELTEAALKEVIDEHVLGDGGDINYTNVTLN